MKRIKTSLLLLCVLSASMAASLSTASAAGGPLARRGGYAYAVSPEMMHAIDVIVSEKMKMRRHAK